MEPMRMELWSVKEVEGTLEYESSLPNLQEVRWLPFMYKFYGFNLAITRAFAEGFDGRKPTICTLVFEVSK